MCNLAASRLSLIMYLTGHPNQTSGLSKELFRGQYAAKFCCSFRERSLLFYFFVVYFASLSVFCLCFLYKSANGQRHFKLILAAVEFLSCSDKNSYIFVLVSLVLSLSLLRFQRVRAYPGLLPHMLGVRK